MFSRIYEIWEKISIRVVLLLCMLIGLWFSYFTGRYTNVFPADYSYECTYVIKDFLIGNLLFFLIWSIVCMVIWRLSQRIPQEKQCTFIHRIVIILTILMAGALFLWLQVCQYVPLYDQEIVYNCALDMAQNNYDCMTRGGYMQVYPYQLDIAFVYQVFFKLVGCDDYAVIQYLNVFSIITTLYFGFLIVKEISSKTVVHICYVMFAYSCVPLFLYTGFVYGDVCAIGATTVAIWALFKWFHSKRKRYAALIIWNLMFGGLMRKTFYIILVAFMIALLYYIAKQKCVKSIILLSLCVMISLGASQFIKAYYEKQSGIEVEKGLPLSYRIAAAMQESAYGAGGYNPDLFLEFYSYANMDYSLFDEYSKAKIEDRLLEFGENRGMAWDFYKRKVMEQWNDHTFSSAFAMARPEWQMGALEQSVLYGTIKQLTDWYMNYYLFILYLGMTIGVMFFWKNKTEVYMLLPLIAMIGGFLFSIFFENMGRYVLPYVVLIQPYAAVGIGNLIIWIYEKCSAGIHRKDDPEKIAS